MFSDALPGVLTAQTEADLGGTLTDALLADLDVGVGVFAPSVALVQPVLDAVLSTVASTLTTTSLLSLPLESALELLIDPLLETLGGGLGEISIGACAPFFVPSGASCNDGLSCTVADACDGAGL